ncbi:hypothetical protein [Treponema sp. OMZ 789]|uniref:hypothetical protein n=1 Tax=Treponema sp. OMZ 789 TaxID=2563670 RepID=UPI0020A2E186|nr:hypothetical protein [Treponema sp. OMZ 789]UTC66799.1 hypothetical protein E4O06_12755 [Treponema sp. OMZ 789]
MNLKHLHLDFNGELKNTAVLCEMEQLVTLKINSYKVDYFSPLENLPKHLEEHELNF